MTQESSSAFVETVFTPRWGDFDVAGHLEHSLYPLYFGEARGRFLTERVGPYTVWPCVMSRIEVDYVREIPFPTAEDVGGQYPAPDLKVRTKVVEIGRSSVKFEQEMVRPDGIVAALSRAVTVAWDTETRSSRSIGDEDRARLLR